MKIIITGAREEKSIPNITGYISKKHKAKIFI